MGQAVKCVKIQLKEEEISGPDCSVFWADSESWTLCLTSLQALVPVCLGSPGSDLGSFPVCFKRSHKTHSAPEQRNRIQVQSFVFRRWLGRVLLYPLSNKKHIFEPALT